jgi:hypothetical protein
MKRSYISAHDYAIEQCRKEKLNYKRVKKLAEKLLKRYAEGQEDWNHGVEHSPEKIREEKQSIRRRYIEIILGIKEYTEEEIADFIWDVVSSAWFREKADAILDKIEYTIDGRVTRKEYDPEKDYQLQGIQIKCFLRKAYLNGKNRIKKEEDIWKEMSISRSTLKRRKPDAIVLFGLLMWKYTVKRELDDIERGVVEAPDYNLKALLEQGDLLLI